MIDTTKIALARDAEFLFAEPDHSELGIIVVVSRVSDGRIDIRRFFWDIDQDRYRPTSKGLRLRTDSIKRLVDGFVTEVFND